MVTSREPRICGCFNASIFNNLNQLLLLIVKLSEKPTERLFPENSQIDISYKGSGYLFPASYHGLSLKMRPYHALTSLIN